MTGALAFLTALLLITGPGEPNAPGSVALVAAQEHSNQNEDVYVFRTMLTKRVVGPDAIAYCGSRVAFVASTNAYFDLVSVGTRPTDGLVTHPKLNVIGRLITCTGSTSNPNVLNFYGEGEIGGIRFKGDGDCARYDNASLAAITSLRCYNRAIVSNGGYVGGLLISNTVAPADLGGTGSVPDGYLATSVAVARFWRKSR